MGRTGPQPEAENAKGVILARAALTIAREDAPGPVVRAILPQGPHAPGARSAPLMKRVGGGVPPLGIPYLVGAPRRGGSKGGNHGGGGAATPFATSATAVRVGRG